MQGGGDFPLLPQRCCHTFHAGTRSLGTRSCGTCCSSTHSTRSTHSRNLKAIQSRPLANGDLSGMRGQVRKGKGSNSVEISNTNVACFALIVPLIAR